MVKYKIGDKVLLRNDLIVGNTYGGVDFVSDLKKYIGKIVTINCVGYGAYKIEGSNYWFSDKMFERKVDNNMFTKEDLKTGMLVKTRNNRLYKVLINTTHLECGYIIRENKRYTELNEFDDNLNQKDGMKEYDIIEVYDVKFADDLLSFDLSKYKLIWKRKEPREMTVEEISAILGYEVKIVE